MKGPISGGRSICVRILKFFYHCVSYSGYAAYSTVGGWKVPTPDG